MSRRAIYGVNDLFTLRPDLMEEWDWERNTELNLVDGSAGRFYIREQVEQKDLQSYINILYEGFERFYLSLWGGLK